MTCGDELAAGCRSQPPHVVAGGAFCLPLIRDWLSDVDWASLAMAILDDARGHDLIVSDDEDEGEDEDA